MQPSSTLLVFLFTGEKSITQYLTFLVLVFKICVTAVLLYSLLSLKNGQSDPTTQNLFKISYLKICFHICMCIYTYIHYGTIITHIYTYISLCIL